MSARAPMPCSRTMDTAASTRPGSRLSSGPCAVSIKIRPASRAVAVRATNCAIMPPIECPSRTNLSQPSALASRSTSSASTSKEYADSSAGLELAPWPRRSGATACQRSSASWSSHGVKSSFAPVNPWTRRSRRGPAPASAIETRTSPRSTSRSVKGMNAPYHTRSTDRTQRGADPGDDRPAERDRGERAEEAGREEPPADPGQRQELGGDRGECEQYRGAVVGDEERQRVYYAAQERARAGDRAAQQRAAAPGQLAGVGEPLGEGHADGGADRGGEPGEE